jgi:hypothetical protein
MQVPALAVAGGRQVVFGRAGVLGVVVVEDRRGVYAIARVKRRFLGWVDGSIVILGQSISPYPMLDISRTRKK